MFAIIELGGKQYQVKEKDVIRIEKLDTAEGARAAAEKVLLVSDGGKTSIGLPYLPHASVTLMVKKTGLNDKVRIFKMKAKKRYKRLRGHRQPYSEVEVVAIKA